MPRATMTQGVPSRLHSRQTLDAGVTGLRPDEEGAQRPRGAAPCGSGNRAARSRRRRGRGWEWTCRAPRDTAARRRPPGRTPPRTAKLRRAWIPPAVAHAPIVTRNRGTPPDAVDPLGVVRRRDGALDEDEVPRAPSRRRGRPRGSCRSKTAPATARSSSSQSRRESWQPSQDANLKTASLGFCVRHSKLPPGHEVPDVGAGEDRTVPADELRPALAVPAQADAALHVPLEGEPHLSRRAPRGAPAPGR